MSQNKLIKVKTFPGASVLDMRFFVVPYLKKKSDNIHVESNTLPHSSLCEMFQEIQGPKKFHLEIFSIIVNHHLDGTTCR